MPSTQPILNYVNSFTVSGLTTRTQNSDEFDKKTAKLPKLWQQFYSSNFRANIKTFGVYSDYESDANGSYTVTVGVDGDNQNPEFATVNINAGNYLVFQGKGVMPLAVIETWQHIWAYFAVESQYQRCFMTDFEAYSGDNEVAIYIGIK